MIPECPDHRKPMEPAERTAIGTIYVCNAVKSCQRCIHVPFTKQEPAAQVPKVPSSVEQAVKDSERKKLEDELAMQLQLLGVPEPIRDKCRPIPGRMWRADFSWPNPIHKTFDHGEGLIVEVEGGIWSQGRHVRGQGFIDDCRKYRAFTLAGWKVLRYTSEDIYPEHGQTIGVAALEIKQALGS